MEPEELGQIDLTNLFPKARDYGAEALVRLLRDKEVDLIARLRSERLPNGERRFVGGGSYGRTLITKLGRVRIEVHRIYDRLRRHTFAPLLMALKLDGRRYVRDLRLACAEEATRTSYGEASEAIHRSLSLWVPRRTIWNFAQELAEWVKQGTRSVPLRETDGAHLADGTYVRGWRRGRQHEVNVAVRQRSSDHKVEVISVKVGGPARSVLPERIDRLVTDDAPAYSSDIAEWHQLCHVHFLRHVTGLLAEEKGLMGIPEREAIVRELASVLGHLRASVEKHRVDGDRVAVTYRIQTTLTRFGEIGADLEGRGLRQAARYVRERGRATVVFAEVTNRGGWMPATSNGVERVMGMIADRCKRKWAHWNRGLENLLQLLLIRKTRPASYGWAVREYLRGSTLGGLSLLGGPNFNKA